MLPNEYIMKWDNYKYKITTSTDYKMGPQGPQGLPADETKIKNLEKELVESKNKIKELEKKLNDFIDNPEKVRAIRKIDPYNEEKWEE